jgi:hypothetical protein
MSRCVGGLTERGVGLDTHRLTAYDFGMHKKKDGMVMVRLDHETRTKLDALVAAEAAKDVASDPPTKSAIIRKLIRGAP